MDTEIAEKSRFWVDTGSAGTGAKRKTKAETGCMPACFTPCNHTDRSRRMTAMDETEIRHGRAVSFEPFVRLSPFTHGVAGSFSCLASHAPAT